MAIFTKLNRRDIHRITKQFGLAPPSEYKGIIEGTVNTIYRLSYPNRKIFLKIDELADRLRLDREIQIFNLLDRINDEIGYATPQLIGTAEGRPYLPWRRKFVLLLEQLPGKSLSQVTQLNTKRYRAIGRALAELHCATQHYQLPTHRFHLQTLGKIFREIYPQLFELHPVVALELKLWLRWLKQHEVRRLPEGLIHADLFLENIHFKGNQVVGILDFEAAGRGSFLFDLAVTIHALCYHGGQFNKTATRSLLGAYLKIREIHRSEARAVEWALFNACLRFLLTRLKDFELNDNLKGRTRPKDFRDYYRRLPQIPAQAVFMGQIIARGVS